MKLLRARKAWKWIIIVAVLVTAAVAWRLLSKPEAFDTRFTGAYRLEDGSLVFIVPREGKILRYRRMNGESSALWPVAERTYEAGPGWAERQPVLHTFTFSINKDGQPDGFTWQSPNRPQERAQRLALPETMFRFSSGNITLRAKLVKPKGDGPFPAVVFVHGADASSAVDTYFEPYLYASHGIAALVFDKRGTGESQGNYTQYFPVLANDVIAAVNALRGRNDIDKNNIHLAGYSQGGWIAPLAAVRDDGIRSVFIGFGPMVPVREEDRWGYIYALRENRFGDHEVRQVDRINDVVCAILDRGENRWSELGKMLDEAKRQPWFATVKRSDCTIGYMTKLGLPLWMVRLYAWWKLRPSGGIPFMDRVYDPVPTLAELKSPSFWILGGQDSSMPTDATIEKLRSLQAAQRPIEYVVYPNAEHGILKFEKKADGERRLIGYEPEYLPQQVRWLQRQSGLE